MNNAKDKIYLAFFTTKKDKLYYNQLKELTKFSHSSLQNVLKKLLFTKEIKLQKTKALTFYSLTNKSKVIEFTKIIKKIVENLNLNVKIPLKEFIEKIPKTIYSLILFGSTLKKQEKKDSDIDLMIILEVFSDDELQKMYVREMKLKINKLKKDIETRSIHSLSIIYTTKEQFEEEEDFLIKEAKLTGIPLLNQLNYNF